LAALNIFVLLSAVPKFTEIYADALPGMPLPAVTNFIIGYRLMLTTATTAWPLVCFLVRKRQEPNAILWMRVGIIELLVQLGVTVIALFMPMAGGIVAGVPEAGH
jgi:hypothetical protein